MGAAGAQCGCHHLEGAGVLLVRLEVADGAVVEAQHQVELVLEVELPQVRLHELDFEALQLGFADRDLEQLGRDVDPDHLEAAAPQLQRVPPDPAGQVEHPLSALRPQHRQRPLHFRHRAVCPRHLRRRGREPRAVPVERNCGGVSH